ncbi:VCBS repeat-containing protein [Maribacter flavus]|uniref:VCBS repeat-containing protein n=1 Tax=Maribacter flavus TaxID=1658664 RepID=A0A5B2TZY4_9FLAO|nr:VCBS repeat-containing protein [Maribacter flavus]KAA2219638.1 VCBS repeat-containing protein [Maribacter flavus]
MLLRVGAFAFLTLLLSSCKDKTSEPANDEKGTVFKLRSAKTTGIDFVNDLTYDKEFNVYRYRNYYNGGGVAIGDINNDSLPDIYFIANQKENRLYLNKGNFQFEDITEKAQVGGTRPWSTGVSMVDINADGFLDIYVCNSGDLNGENKQNELFINQQDGTFKEMAADYNLDDKGFSTHASFFDFDKDGDLDVYILNNSYKAIGGFDLKKNERNKRDILGGDKLMENVDGTFVDISEKAGIYGSVIGFGLGVTVGDVDNDGWEDIYVSNDFFERDYLYINNQDGTFTESLENQITATSVASMGADMADINNDGYNDIFVTEMLPSEYERLKTVTTFEDWNKYQLNLNNGYYHQFTRNTFQLNNADNTFSEIGRLSGVEASDWSWGALIFDMDHDGLKDLFIANGVYQDLTDQDYLTYISNTEILKSMITTDSVNYAKLIDLIPSNKVENHAYKNLGNLEFKKYEESGLLVESFSNGAAYGDLDNDGDLDLVVNNLNMESFVYENTTMDSKKSNYLKFDLRGEGKNTYAVGSKIEVLPYNISVENQPVRGFQSSMDIRPNIGLPNNQNVSVKITWPSGKITQLNDINVNRTIILYEKEAEVQALDKSNLETPLFQKVEGLLDFVHKENRFVDFDRDRLLNHMVSTEGPKMALGDVNGDGRIDLFIGGSKGNPPSLFINTDNGFVQKKTSDFDQSKNSEDMESIFFDADGDNDMDLYVCSGGIEYSQYSAEFLDRLYINDGKGNFKLSDQKLPVSNTFHSSSTIDVSDIDQDGDLDIFVGERMIPLKYGMAGSGFLLENDGTGNFTDITMTAGTDFQGMGMITSALFQDLDDDGDEDLIIVGEFMGIEIYINETGKFVRKADNPLLDLKGWWNTILPSDLDGDGDVDFIVGNHGLNSRFKASKDRPIRLYAADFDGNGFIDPILTFRREDGQDYPYALRHDLIEQIKAITKKYPDYESFKDASVSAIFSEEALKEARTLEANTLESVILVNNGNLTFEVLPLPIAAQFSTTYAIATNDFDGDGDQDIVLGGNLYNVKPEVGRYDASYGVYMENKGGLKFETIKSGKGFKVKGEIRDMGIIDQKLFVSRNRDSLAIFKFN